MSINGLQRYPYLRLLMPLAVELAMVTGLNFESIKMLEIDSLQLRHGLTGQPVLKYQKARSGSSRRPEDRELHFASLEIEELFLNDSVCQRVFALWELVVSLTSKLRELAPAELSRRLFIFEHVEQTRRTGRQTIVPIEPKGKASNWYGRFCREEGIYAMFGDKFNFSISRCRPTFATNMVLAGAGLHQVQVALGHQSAQTTACYLDGHRLRPVFNKTVSEAMAAIAKRSSELRENKTVDSSIDACEVGSAALVGFHETLSGCGCVNPYQPSEHVRSVTELRHGAVCKHWNMCLLCDNSVITENSLPKLILYRNRLRMALDGGSPAIAFKVELYRDAIKMIDGVLQSGVMFPADVIERAVEAAATMNSLLVDQIIYQGV